MACSKIKNEKNKIKSSTRLKIVSCSPVHFNGSKNNSHILIGNNGGFLQPFRLAPVRVSGVSRLRAQS
jgi:hypothetical protein